jgi:hypothetical protein
MNINAALTMNNNFLTNVAGISLYGQGSTPSTNGTLYNSNNSSGDLYYVNAAGLAIQLTNSSGIVGSAGSISGISGTASASYSTPTFFWRSATGIAANMDMAAAIMRNISPNSTYAVTLQPPASLAANYSIVLPTLPAATGFVTMDTSGNLSAATALLGALTTSNLSPTAGITGSQLANQTITSNQIANNTITVNQIASTTLSNGQYVPNASATSNISIVAIPSFQYVRTADVVTISGTMTVHVTSGIAFSFELDLPVANNNFSAGTNAGGSGICMSSGLAAGVQAVASTKKIQIVGGGGTAGLDETMSVHFTYLVV